MKRINRDHLYENITILDDRGQPVGQARILKPNTGLKDHLTKAELKVLERLPLTYQLSIALSSDPFEAFYSHVEMVEKARESNPEMWRGIVANSKKR